MNMDTAVNALSDKHLQVDFTEKIPFTRDTDGSCTAEHISADWSAEVREEGNCGYLEATCAAQQRQCSYDTGTQLSQVFYAVCKGSCPAAASTPLVDTWHHVVLSHMQFESIYQFISCNLIHFLKNRPRRLCLSFC